jgi:hypothetical protein
MSRASDYAITLFKQAHGPLRCLAASDPCNRRKAAKPQTQAPAPRKETSDPKAKKEGTL